MPNTVYYSFPTPADTDLVKNGADAIRDLGDAVDTAMNTALGTKKSGLVLLNTTSFSAVASQAVSSVFTSTYNTFRIIISLTGTSTDNIVYLKLRDGVTDSSLSQYSWMRTSTSTAGTVGGAGAGSANTGWNLFETDGGNSAAYYTIYMDVSNPNVAVAKTFAGNGTFISNTGTILGFNVGGHYNTTNVLDGINIIASAGNITGSVNVYGYNK